MDFTLDGVRQYVRTKLGEPSMDVELADTQLDLCVEDALRLYNQFHSMPEVQTTGVAEVSDEVVIDAPSKEIKGVLWVDYIRPENLQQVINDLNFILYRMVYPYRKFGVWHEMRSFFEMHRKTRGSEPDWVYDRQTRKLLVNAWSGPISLAIIWGKEVTLADIDERKSEHRQMFLDGVTANAMILLARIRGKFGGIPAPGGIISLDSAELRAEGQTNLAAYKTSLLKTTPPLPIIQW